MDKYIQPGKWDTSVGGYLGCGETFEEAVYREMKEELNIVNVPVKHLYDYWLRNRCKKSRKCSLGMEKYKKP